jgi:hypothetical protein
MQDPRPLALGVVISDRRCQIAAEREAGHWSSGTGARVGRRGIGVVTTGYTDGFAPGGRPGQFTGGSAGFGRTCISLSRTGQGMHPIRASRDLSCRSGSLYASGRLSGKGSSLRILPGRSRPLAFFGGHASGVLSRALARPRLPKDQHQVKSHLRDRWIWTGAMPCRAAAHAADVALTLANRRDPCSRCDFRVCCSAHQRAAGRDSAR